MPFSIQTLTGDIMRLNYFKVAIRNMLAQKFYSSLNILGLAVGMAASFLIMLYVTEEMTFDRFHYDYQNIYQTGMHVRIGGQEFKVASSCPPLAAAMLDEIPGVEQATRLIPRETVLMKYEDKSFTEERAFMADSNFFVFFSFPLLEGDASTALKAPHSIVLTTASALRYFANEQAVGRIITVDKEAFTVTGVAAVPPSNSQIQFDMLLSSASDIAYRNAGWDDSDGTLTYFRKNPDTPLPSVESKLRDFVMRHIAPQIEQGFNVSFADFEKQGGIYTFFTYALSESHLYHPEIADTPIPPGDARNVYILSGVGVFILLVACINFMNLSTARSARRAKEVGLRKTVGSSRSQLIIQFLTESSVLVLVATVIGIALCYLCIPAFNLLTGKALVFQQLMSPATLVTVSVIFVITALLAGSYPAFYLTSFNPVDVLKGRTKTSGKSKTLRSLLVVIQFSISTALIICTMVVFRQLRFLQDKGIGLDNRHVLELHQADKLGNNHGVFRDALRNVPGIVNASYTTNSFPGVNAAVGFHVEGLEKDMMFPFYSADYNHLEVLKIELADGRYFSPEFPADTLTCVINEAAAKELGWTDPLGRKIKIDERFAPQVIGVVKDFNFETAKIKVRPLIILPKQQSDNLLIRYTGNAGDAVAALERLWKQYAPGEPCDYTFLDEDFDHVFREERRLGQLFASLSGVAIFIACLGLLGLASFTAEQRTKEIGIRKVLGATVSSVNSMLSKEFLILVLISFAIASAVSWMTMNAWLNTFAYRIEQEPFVFVLAAIIAIGLAWITVSYHFIRAARSSPVDALRCDQ